jgi:hypothetical protein
MFLIFLTMGRAPLSVTGLRRFAELHTRHTGEPLHPVIFVR